MIRMVGGVLGAQGSAAPVGVLTLLDGPLGQISKILNIKMIFFGGYDFGTVLQPLGVIKSKNFVKLHGICWCLVILPHTPPARESTAGCF